ncbi:MAG TPA: NADP-dependent oxidoreductase [Candidatus Blautia stercoravium]|nr:NADP-dependent oxidoreductase [Candidatus Blautia stercoravium]
MKAAQIKKYSRNIQTSLCEIPVPEIGDSEVLVKVKAAAVNPLEILILTGSVKLIQDYSMPLTLGNECSGIVEKVGSRVKGFQKGDRVYTRLPLSKIGAFAEYVAVDQHALAKMPEGYDFSAAAAIPLTGLTAYQGIVEELEAKPGETVLIPGGSGSFGQMAVPIAKALGLRVIVTGNARAEERLVSLGADQYIDYKKENYWEKLSEIDYVIDTLGTSEFEHELSVLKKGGRLLSLRTGPNKAFAVRNHFSGLKKVLFTLAGSKYDKAARKQGKEYRFMFVRSDGAQLRKITEIVEKQHIVPAVDSRVFSLSQVNDALQLVAKGSLNGKVIIQTAKEELS